MLHEDTTQLDIHSLLRHLRIINGLSLQQVGVHLHLAESSVRRWEMSCLLPEHYIPMLAALYKHPAASIWQKYKEKKEIGKKAAKRNVQTTNWWY